MTSTPLTILPGQVGRGVVAVWPRTIVRSGAEPALPGQDTATRAASSAAARVRAGARRRPRGLVSAGRGVIWSSNPAVEPGLGEDFAFAARGTSPPGGSA